MGIQLCSNRSVLVFAVAWLSIAATAGAHAGQPQRVVSINLCADELLLTLADREQISSVTWLVNDPTMSWLGSRARGIPVNHGLAEEVILHDPDLVLAGRFSTRATVDTLRKLGFNVLELIHPADFAQIKAQISQLGDILGQSARANQIISDLEARLAGLSLPGAGDRPTAVFYQANGITTGAGSLADDLLRLAGLTNLAARRGLANYDRYPLEALIFDRPDILVMDSEEGAAPALANELLRHPLLEKVFSDSRRVTVPGQSWACGTPNVIEAIEILHASATRDG